MWKGLMSIFFRSTEPKTPRGQWMQEEEAKQLQEVKERLERVEAFIHKTRRARVRNGDIDDRRK
jgi:hypothetical protein